MRPTQRIIEADCRVGLASIESHSIDAAITDPPYAEINRSYGRLTESEWHALMYDVITEVRRVLKPSGSAVFILQPNSEHVGSMRPWLWEFVAKYAREWNLIQDVYWWNHASPPTVHCQARHGLMRPSVKYCVWLGPADCYRDQSAILWSPSQSMVATMNSENWEGRSTPSGQHTNMGRIAKSVRDKDGKVTPYNLLPMSNTDSREGAGAWGHGAGTPYALCDFWMRYIVPRDGISLDCFAGTGTTGLAAKHQSKSWIGIEQSPEYAEIARLRVEKGFHRPVKIDQATDQNVLEFG